MDLYVTFFLIIITIIFFLKIRKSYVESKTIIEKVVIWLILIMCLAPIIIYYVDLFDIPSRFGWTKNCDVNNWFNFISTYISSIVGTLISSGIVVLITIKQIRTQINSNNEDKRIQNAPILKYNISQGKKVDFKKVIMDNGEGKMYCLDLNIENIGLNHARHIKLKISDLQSNKVREMGIDEQQSILTKGESICLRIILHYDIATINQKEIKISVSYEDLLKNKYKQVINIVVEPTNALALIVPGFKLDIISAVVGDEKMINYSK